MTLENLTPLNGFDKSDLDNAKQNNYAWSMCELGDYIYVGTGKNIGLATIDVLTSSLGNLQMPAALITDDYDDKGEIWRYKKDGTRKWERVYKLKDQGNNGFRYMINYIPYNARIALLASSASIDNSVPIKILMTYDGVYWKEVQGNVKGTSSRSMEVHNGKLYVATSGKAGKSYLYSSDNPEIESWKTILDSDAKGYNPAKNPSGTIFNIKSFNNHLYVAINSKNGSQVWRSNSSEPKMNEWTMIGEPGYGNEENKFILSMNVYKKHLYFSTSGDIPKIFLIPKGADLIRIDKYDNYEVIVGNKNSRSGYLSGFDNPLNLYMWQLCEYDDDLYVTTFDNGSNLQTFLEIILLNKELVKKYLDASGYKGENIDVLIKELKHILKVFDKIDYQYGFDIFVSHDGVNFDSIMLDGMKNAENYGGRMLYVDSENDLYIGTANPYEGLEVWKSNCNIKKKYNYYDEESLGFSIIRALERIEYLFK